MLRIGPGFPFKPIQLQTFTKSHARPVQHDPKIILRDPEHLAKLRSIHSLHFPKHKDVRDALRQFVQATPKRLPKLFAIQRSLRIGFPIRRSKRVISTLIDEFVRHLVFKKFQIGKRDLLGKLTEIIANLVF